MCVQDVDVQCVLQFTLIHAASCALHRRTSRVIHRIELCLYAILWVGLRLPCMCIHLNGLTVAGATPVSRPRLFRAVYSRTRGLGMACFRPATLVGAACHTHRTYALQRSRFGPVKDGAAVLRRQYRQGAPRTPCPLEYIITQRRLQHKNTAFTLGIARHRLSLNNSFGCSSPRRETGPQPASRCQRPSKRTTHRTTKSRRTGETGSLDSAKAVCTSTYRRVDIVELQ